MSLFKTLCSVKVVSHKVHTTLNSSVQINVKGSADAVTQMGQQLPGEGMVGESHRASSWRSCKCPELVGYSHIPVTTPRII